MQNIAPEAYTQRELAEAVTWREDQPDYVKKMTTTPDSLMSFYKRTQRTGALAASLSYASPIGFHGDLKNLAEDMRSAEKPPSTHHLTDKLTDKSADKPTGKFEAGKFETVKFEAGKGAIAPNPNVLLGLDANSQAKVLEVAKALNIGDPAEALRALIALGYEKIRPVLPVTAQ